jgi:ADP-ribosylglycohydrolase
MSDARDSVERVPDLPGGYTLHRLVRLALYQARYDGQKKERIDALEHEFLALSEQDEASLRRLWKRVRSLPLSKRLLRNEPDDLAAIRCLRPQAPARQYAVPDDDDWLYDRLYGAWLGRCAGCTLAVPAENFRPHTRRLLKEYLTAISADEWPVRDYLPDQSPAPKRFHPNSFNCCRGRVRFAPQDDDLTWPVISLIALQQVEHPLAMQSRDAAAAWFNYLPYAVTVGGAGMAAYRNLAMRYPMETISRSRLADDQIDWQWVARHSNPYAFDLDAAIRADPYGYVSPGLPEAAAGLAWRDARISNTRGGIYYSMLVAAMIAAAFAESEPEAVIRAGMAEIPQTSRLYQAAVKVLALCRGQQGRDDRVDAVHAAIYETFGDDHLGTENNMALVLAALLLGGHDFERVITYALMGGWDCDCVAATAGSVAGAMLGARALPAKWVGPLNDTVYTLVPGYHPVAISELARQTTVLARRSRQAGGLQG